MYQTNQYKTAMIEKKNVLFLFYFEIHPKFRLIKTNILWPAAYAYKVSLMESHEYDCGEYWIKMTKFKEKLLEENTP